MNSRPRISKGFAMSKYGNNKMARLLLSVSALKHIYIFFRTCFISMLLEPSLPASADNNANIKPLTA